MVTETEIEKKRPELNRGCSTSSGSFHYEKHRDKDVLIVSYGFKESQKFFEVASLEEADLVFRKALEVAVKFAENKILELARLSFDKALADLIKKYMRGGKLVGHSEMKAVAITVKETSRIYFHYIWDHFRSRFLGRKKGLLAWDPEKDLYDYFMALKEQLMEVLNPVCEILITEKFSASDKRYLLRPYYTEFWWPNDFTEEFTKEKIENVVSGLVTGAEYIQKSFREFEEALTDYGEEFVPAESTLIDQAFVKEEKDKQRVLDVIKKYDEGEGTTYEQLADEFKDLTVGKLDDLLFKNLMDSKLFEPSPGRYRVNE